MLHLLRCLRSAALRPARRAGIALGLSVVIAHAASCQAAAEPADAVNAPPTPQQWATLGKLPDWSGVWTPDIPDQDRRERADPVPWTPTAARQVAALSAQERAGNPKLLFWGCLPESMPAWMLVNHNALEILFTPGRVTLLGESDGNRLRRIYTDGRKHPADPDPTFHGHSIGHWEGDTLVVDTVGVRPQAYIAVSESVGVPNNGGMRIVERFHLRDPQTLQIDLEITAPKVLTRPWKTSRIYYRQRKQKYDIVEGVCEEGSVAEARDRDGNEIFVPRPNDEQGNHQ